MSIDLDTLRQTYMAERPLYERLAKKVKVTLVEATRTRGIEAQIDSRAKDVASFVKKQLRKSYTDPLNQIRDKAGVRVTVIYYDELALVSRIIEQLFVVHSKKDKRLETNYDELSYRGTHFEIGLRQAQLESDMDLTNLVCEVQVRTHAEHTWSMVSHDLLYKPAHEPDDTVKRRIYRLIALVEIMDSEIQGARDAVLSSPSFQEASMLDQLEQHYYQFTATPFDRELSALVLTQLKKLYTVDELEGFASLIEEFVSRNMSKFQQLFSDYQSDEMGLLFYQPESFAVLERLSKMPHRLKDAWAEVLPIALLESMANMWGVSID